MILPSSFLIPFLNFNSISIKTILKLIDFVSYPTVELISLMLMCICVLNGERINEICVYPLVHRITPTKEEKKQENIPMIVCGNLPRFIPLSYLMYMYSVEGFQLGVCYTPFCHIIWFYFMLFPIKDKKLPLRILMLELKMKWKLFSNLMCFPGKNFQSSGGSLIHFPLVLSLRMIFLWKVSRLFVIKVE